MMGVGVGGGNRGDMMFQSTAAPECQDKPLQPQNSILMFFLCFRRNKAL